MFKSKQFVIDRQVFQRISFKNDGIIIGDIVKYLRIADKESTIDPPLFTGWFFFEMIDFIDIVDENGAISKFR